MSEPTSITAETASKIAADVNTMRGTRWAGNDAAYDRATGERRGRERHIARDSRTVVVRVPQASGMQTGGPVSAADVVVLDRMQQAGLVKARAELRRLQDRLARLPEGSPAAREVREDIKYAKCEAGDDKGKGLTDRRRGGAG